MSYSFSTRSGQAASAVIPTKHNLSGYTLTVEVDDQSDFATPTTVGTAVYTNGSIHLTFTSSEVNSIGDCYYRIKAVGAKTFFAARGNINYTNNSPTTVPDSLLDAQGYIKDEYVPPRLDIPEGAMVVLATENTALADEYPEYVWLILDPAEAGVDNPPAPPTGLVLTPGDGTILADWADVADSDLNRYEYRMGTTNPPTGTPTSTGINSLISLTGLTNGTQYWVQVRSVDDAGQFSDWTTPLSATPTASASVPGAPTGVTATAGNAQATVNWTAPASNGGAAITDYLVQYSSDSGTTWTAYTDPVSVSTSTTVTGLVNGTAYTFRVAAVNSVGTSAYSTASSAVTPTSGASTTPSVVSRDSGFVTNASALTVPITTTPQVGDDIFVMSHVQTGSGSIPTITGFETTATRPANITGLRMDVFRRRFQAGDDPATMVRIARSGGSSSIHGKVIVVRGLDPAATSLATVQATTETFAIVPTNSTSMTIGPTGTPSQARVFALAMAYTVAAHNGGLTASGTYQVGGVDTARSMSAAAFFTDGAAQTVTLGWATGNEAHGALLLLKAAA